MCGETLVPGRERAAGRCDRPGRSEDVRGAGRRPTMKASAPAPGLPPLGGRIAKRIARAGICSRRDAEKLILAGRVAVDGTVLTTPAVTVTEASRITVDGKALAVAEHTRRWRFHKPRGVVTTNRDPQGRQAVFDVLPPELPRVVTEVGRAPD